LRVKSSGASSSITTPSCLVYKTRFRAALIKLTSSPLPIPLLHPSPIALSMKPRTYAEAGVDISREALSIKAMAEHLAGTLAHRAGKVGESLTGIGHFSALLKLSSTLALAINTDGVGSKLLVAEAAGRYDTVGIDLVAMNANDIICVGAEPVAMVDYLAVEEPEPEVAGEIAKGIARGAELAGVSVVGGETATLPEIVRGFDLAATMVGVVEVDRVVTGEEVRPGDAVLGLRSSGIHSNGLTLARKLILGEYGVEEEVLPGKKAWEVLLEPTRIYVREVLEVLQKLEVHGLAHITGGGLGNLCRLTRHGFLLDALPEPQEVFTLIQELGDIPPEEMYRTFNMGVGFCIVLPEEHAGEAAEICRRHGTEAQLIGRVVEGRNTVRIQDAGVELGY